MSVMHLEQLALKETAGVEKNKQNECCFVGAHGCPCKLRRHVKHNLHIGDGAQGVREESLWKHTSLR